MPTQVHDPKTGRLRDATRKEVHAMCHSAGQRGDQAALLRLYAENHIGLAAAQASYRTGARFADFVRERDARLSAMRADANVPTTANPTT